MQTPAHVLVVDDDDEIRRVVRRGFEREGFTVEEAADGTEAIDLASGSPIDVVILDLHLPDMSGLDVLARLRRTVPDLHVIMLTGAGREEDRVLGLVSGADDYVVKPFSVRELAARVIAAQRRRMETPSATIEIDGLHIDQRTRQVKVAPLETEPRAEPAFDPGASDDAVVVLVGTSIVHATPAAAQLVGAPGIDALLGADMFDFVAEQSLGAATARHQSVRSGHRPRPEVLTLRGVDGSERLVEVASAPVVWEGQPASQLTVWDATHDPSALQELATGIRSDVADAVMITDAQLRIQRFNRAAEELYGWSEDEVIGRSSMEVLPWVHGELEMDSAREAFQRDGHWHAEIVQKRRDGTPVTVQSTSTLLRDSAGRPVGVVSVNRPMASAGHGPTSPDHDVKLAAEIHRGIERGEFVVHYQPVVRLANGSWSGVEALVRWQHPDRGLLAPAAFIEEAERSGAIVKLGHRVLEQACSDLARWSAAGHDLELAVNLSGRQLADPDLPEQVRLTMNATGVPDGKLWFEVTETSLVQDLAQAKEQLEHIETLGVRFAIDDFGTGWASLTYLREFPVHALKIDRIFVEGLGASTTDAAIVSSVIRLAAELDLVAIAEGIETPGQLAHLVQLGCEVGQGYLFSRPSPLDALGIGVP